MSVVLLLLRLLRIFFSNIANLPLLIFMRVFFILLVICGHRLSLLLFYFCISFRFNLNKELFFLPLCGHVFFARNLLQLKQLLALLLNLLESAHELLLTRADLLDESVAAAQQ